jgi:hypothetical protein
MPADGTSTARLPNGNLGTSRFQSSFLQIYAICMCIGKAKRCLVPVSGLLRMGGHAARPRVRDPKDSKMGKKPSQLALCWP